MTSPRWTAGQPKRILLATDLSARCDRAMDRAVALAKEWRAKLVVLHVIERSADDMSDSDRLLPSWRRPADPAAAVRRRLAGEITSLDPSEVQIVVERGDVVDLVLQTAASSGCGLIVTGIARDELLGRLSLGGTVNRLVRRSQVPILVVRDRPRGPYRNIVVATDFSETSGYALSAAAHLFPAAACTVFHAYDPPLASRVMDQAAYHAEGRAIAEADSRRFLQEAAVPQGWRASRVVVERGSPSWLLRDYADHEGADLVVVGSHGRSAIFTMLLGSVARDILDMAPCDALVVREPRAATDG